MCHVRAERYYNSPISTPHPGLLFDKRYICVTVMDVLKLLQITEYLCYIQCLFLICCCKMWLCDTIKFEDFTVSEVQIQSFALSVFQILNTSVIAYETTFMPLTDGFSKFKLSLKLESKPYKMIGPF